MATDDLFLCCFSCVLPEEEKNRRIRSRDIDRELSRARVQFRRIVKILLLGSGESGKSTFLKQMRIINGRVFQEDELKLYKIIIFNNVVVGMKVLIDARDKLGIPFELEGSAQRASFVFNFDSNIKLEEPVFLQYVAPIAELWKDKGIQTAYDRRREFLLGDSTKYFMENLNRIGQMNYIPTNQDILYSRKATKGVSEHDFPIYGVPFRFVDVGGQRSQRQKWFQCFQDVKSILFLVSSSEFDQVIYEDRRTNRLIESCNIFEAIVNNRTFDDVSIILFLNKTDLLKEKIKTVSIKEWFPQFTGNPSNIDDVQRFLVMMFDSRRHDRSKPLFHHFTTAVDTENIKHVFHDVKDTILAKNLDSLMLQ